MVIVSVANEDGCWAPLGRLCESRDNATIGTLAVPIKHAWPLGDDDVSPRERPAEV
jgi:hypothetical protein